jgi:hypothetical protein
MGLGAVGLCSMMVMHKPDFFKKKKGGWISLHRLLQDVIENHFSCVRFRSGHGGVTVTSANKAANASHAMRLFKSSKSNCAGAMEDPDGTEGKKFDFRDLTTSKEQKLRDAKVMLH